MSTVSREWSTCTTHEITREAHQCETCNDGGYSPVPPIDCIDAEGSDSLNPVNMSEELQTMYQMVGLPPIVQICTKLASP